VPDVLALPGRDPRAELLGLGVFPVLDPSKPTAPTHGDYLWFAWIFGDKVAYPIITMVFYLHGSSLFFPKK
jgi:hypothetical protein